MNYPQYLDDYWPEEVYTHEYDQTDYYDQTSYDQVTCIDRQIAELEARRDALIHGYCFTGYLPTKTYLDPYGLGNEEELP